MTPESRFRRRLAAGEAAIAMYDFKGKTVICTGAGNGLGLEVVKRELRAMCVCVLTML